MDFHQRGQSGGAGQRVQLLQFPGPQDARDQQNGVRARLDRFQNLPAINNEVLAQKRQFHGGANLPQIIQRTLEKFFIRQDRKAVGSGRLVLPAQSAPDRSQGKSRRRRARLF